MSAIFSSELLELAHSVLAAMREKHLRLTTAESCTGGLIATLCTEIPGSSDVFERGFVTYSNQSKHETLGVSDELIEELGAVSPEVASAMAVGALAHSKADMAISVTGIAGPGGGTSDKPVGLVYIGFMRKGGTAFSQKFIFTGERSEIRVSTVKKALEIIHDKII